MTVQKNVQGILERKLTGFDHLVFRGPGTLKVQQGDEESLQIEAPDYVLERIEARVENQVLHLGYRSPRVICLQAHRESISYNLTVKDLKALTLNGSGRVVIPDLDNDQFSLRLSGGGYVLLNNLTADRFEVVISGMGSVKVAGDVESQVVTLSGAGSYAAASLVSDYAEVRISGAGHAAITAGDEIKAVISGAGSISYAGYPEITRQISGVGKIFRRRRIRQVTRGSEHG